MDSELNFFVCLWLLLRGFLWVCCLALRCSVFVAVFVWVLLVSCFFLMYLKAHRCQHEGNKQECYGNPASTVIINET